MTLRNSCKYLSFMVIALALIPAEAQNKKPEDAHIKQIVTAKEKPLDTTMPEPTNFTEDKPNLLVEAKHPEFTIKLKSNPTTGFSWFLREYDANIIQPVKHRFEAGEKKLIGAPGAEYWTFRIKPTGFIVPQQTVIRMIYARPWQGSDSATQLVVRVSTQGK